jgi:hypothetical protein
MSSGYQKSFITTSERRISAQLKARDCILRRGTAKQRIMYMTDISKIYPSVEIDFHDVFGVEKTIPLGNMSLCRLDGAESGYLVSVRQFNYKIRRKDEPGGWFGGFLDKRAYFFAIVDKNFRFLRKLECDMENLSMFEDLRLLKYGNIIQASGTEVSLGWKEFRMASIDFNLSQNVLHAKKVCLFPVKKEKNYMPVEDGRGIFVSDLMLNSLNVVSTSNPSNKIIQRCRGLVQYRGSSPLMRYRDGYVALVHTKRKNVYSNAFAFFDKRLQQCRISDEFTVFSDVSSINFCCGMSIEGDEAILPVCVHDRWTYLFRLPLQDFSKTARWRDLNR